MNLEKLRARKGFICDMDGVIYLGNQLLPGVREFVSWLNENGKQFLFLTNSSERSPKELRQKLQRMGLDIDEEHFYTSALATAAFLKKQAPGCTAFVIGAPGLLNALYDVGVTMNDVDPDYVIVGETASYNYEVITKAVRLVLNGAGARTRVVSRSVAKEQSTQVFYPRVQGNAPCFGHVSCDSIIMGAAKVRSIPEISCNHVDATLMHEAAIGKIAGEQLLKLETLGLTPEEAEEKILEGFLR